MTFERDEEGIGEVLKVMCADEIAALTLEIAAAVGDDAEVNAEVTDRARGTVTVPAELQAKDGALTRAASAAGLEVTAYTPRARRSRSPRKPRTTTEDGVAI